MAIGWKRRTAAIGVATAAVLATGAATGTAQASTRVMNAKFKNELGCVLDLSAADPGGTRAAWVQRPPTTVGRLSDGAWWSVSANLGLWGTAKGSAEYVTRDCNFPAWNGITVRLEWTLMPTGVNSYSGWTSNTVLEARLETQHYGLSPVFLLTQRPT
ncbi:hypothetical protein [Actinomadura macrotermitis]|uniref:Uncharacterized protein n=1 Tax=Actinomadura macrotermitis TaxID=2585200 RepID=A0A7K0C1V9_9ACTN|nr:hypothetical protein [Actinomadura macrotermitis]MQY07453.1 hypothetical protein [Actinomadura macrotermitis]